MMNRKDEWLQLIDEMPQVDGVAMTSLLELPTSLSKLLRQMMKRRGVTAVEFAAALDVSEPDVAQLSALFIEKGYVKTQVQKETGETVYRTNLLHVRGRDKLSGLWDDKYSNDDAL
ncbi:MAG: hypothetical protein GY943_18945 [Chloroflexi bacterium]|nr:hypothetical protein [Chloroflexota bacterium]